MSWLDDLVQHAHRNLTSEIREVLWGRGVTDEQMDMYGVGFLAHDLPDLPYPADFLAWARQPHRLDRVLLFPLTTATGEVRGLQLRALARARKGYMNYMPYREEALLFGLAQAMPHAFTSESIWLVEGAFDLFPIQRHFPAVVATLTARVPELLIPIMRRLVTHVLVGYDSDAAGESATKQFIRQHRSEFNVQPVRYPKVTPPGSDQPVKDPADLWEVWGDERVGQFVRSVLPTELFHA